MKRSINKKPSTMDQTKLSKTEMENIRRQRLRDEFRKTRDIIDSRRPNLNCKMEHGDILEQMRELFLATEKQLKACELQLSQAQQTSNNASFQSLLHGFNLGKQYTEFVNFNKTLMTNNGQTTEHFSTFLQQMQQLSNSSEPELSTTFNSTNTQTDESTNNLSLNNSP